MYSEGPPFTLVVIKIVQCLLKWSAFVGKCFIGTFHRVPLVPMNRWKYVFALRVSNGSDQYAFILSYRLCRPPNGIDVAHVSVRLERKIKISDDFINIKINNLIKEPVMVL